MESFLNNHIQRVFSDFMQNEWCDINQIELNTDCYEKQNIQQFYILKYFPAYFSEYYLMYQELIDKTEEKNLNLASIGCGSGIDYYALEFALKEKATSEKTFTYTGIDCISWDYVPNSTEFNFIHTYLSDVKPEVLENKNVIIFPKSLIEFKISDLESMVDKLVEKNENENIYFLNSYITKDAHDLAHIGGIKEFQSICERMRAHGFEVGENECLKYFRAEEQRGLGKDFTFFKYPDEVKKILQDLTANCESEVMAEKCNTCKIGAWPILNNKYVAYNIVKFSKS